MIKMISSLLPIFFPFVCLPASVFAIQSNRFSLSHTSVAQQVASAEAHVASSSQTVERKEARQPAPTVTVGGQACGSGWIPEKAYVHMWEGSLVAREEAGCL